MSEHSVLTLQCPGGEARLAVTVNDGNRRVTAIRLEIDPGVVGSIVLSTGDQTFTQVATGEGHVVSRNVPAGAGYTWQAGTPPEGQDGLALNGERISVSGSYVAPSGGG